jgi:hypothetical protein
MSPRTRRGRAAGLACSILIGLAATATAAPFAGNVLDGATLRPVTDATLTTATGQTATTDAAGAFRFADLPAGPLHLELTSKVYDPSSEDLELPEGGNEGAVIVMFAPGTTGEVVEISDESPVPEPPGKQDLRREEIARIPGTRGDALQSLRSLPGVGANTVGGPGLLIIRGASPQDSRISIDGIEVPILYHFFGLQSVLPTEFISNIEFAPGGFGVESGRATGGVINVVTRDEAIDKASGFAELSFINLAALVQTPVSKANHLQLTAAIRRSAIDFILPAVLSGSSVKFTTAPTYYDGQLRLDWRPRDADRFTAFLLTSFDELKLINNNIDPNDPLTSSGATFDQLTSFTRLIGTWAHGHDGLTNRLVASLGVSDFRFAIGADRFLKFGGKVAELREDAAYKVGPQLTVRAGGDARWASNDLDIKFPGQPAEGEPPPTSLSTGALIDYKQTIDANVASLYGAADLRPTKATTITAGLRGDYYHHIRQGTLSPRLQVSQQLTPALTLKVALGRYTQPLQQGESVPTTLRPEVATQYVVGVEDKLSDGVSLATSAFYTDREQIVVRDPLLVQTDPLNAYVNRGRGRSFGAEVLLRARRNNVFGWLAYTLSRSDRHDAELGPQRLFDFDQTHILVAVASYKRGKWEVGGRFQLATGTPDTPVLGATYLADANIYLPKYGPVNSTRIETAHQLDVRVDRHFTFDGWALSAYLDVTNVYANAAVLGYSYNYDYSQRQAIKNLPILPALGVRGSF